ncbi:DUF502 domain-containing protein [Aestuariibacter halophilus]|uniref:DUF502 domain-containing protein n=1 Tax=Fluctibacter halophilus TaxID=226011 RepID=A0ABS8G9I2_9ALTE|nr:DUF502 domain-containing protein [Aestuariibacter halophilus]MCC2617104.1 DUF502 domain-containing protein [Aestuariibacter halophilus]
MKLLSLSLKGIAALLPLSLTLYFLYWFMSGAEALLRPYIPPQWYIPGIGILLACSAIVIVGLLVNLYFFNALVSLVNRQLEKIPLVKSLFGAIQDTMTVFKINDTSEKRKVVSVEIMPGIRMIGFVTGEHSGTRLFDDSDTVGVYLPLSYQIGGYTLYVPRNQLTNLDISVEEAMRLALTGGAQSQR